MSAHDVPEYGFRSVPVHSGKHLMTGAPQRHVPERQQFVRINRIDERPQIIVAMSAPTSGDGVRGKYQVEIGAAPSWG